MRVCGVLVYLAGLALSDPTETKQYAGIGGERGNGMSQPKVFSINAKVVTTTHCNLRNWE